MPYIEPPVVVDPVALAEEAFAYIEGVIPGWLPSPGNLDTLIIEAIAAPAAEQAEVASGMLTSAFRYFGPLLGVPPLNATPASATVLFTVTDTAGYTIPAGSTIGLRDANGDLQGFTLPVDLVIPATQSTGSITVNAEVAGTQANGLSGVAELVNVPGSVVSAVFPVATQGGGDAEDDETYLDRLTETLTTISPRPLLTVDWAILARETTTIYRASAVDNLKPGPPYDATAEATGQPLVTTIAVTDVNGVDPGPTARAACLANLQALRGQNYVPYVVAAQYSAIDVSAVVRPWTTYDAADVAQRVKDALTNALNPAVWGIDQTNDPASWAADNVIRQSELYEVVTGVDGVRYCSALTFALHGGGLATTDVTMGAGSLIPALPTAGSISIATVPA